MGAPADAIGTRVPAPYTTVAPDAPDACMVTTTGRWNREFLGWMALMDAELEVLEPSDPADEAARLVMRLQGAAGLAVGEPGTRDPPPLTSAPRD